MSERDPELEKKTTEAMLRVGDGETYGPIYVRFLEPDWDRGRIRVRGDCQECGAGGSMTSDGREWTLRYLAQAIMKARCPRPDGCIFYNFYGDGKLR